MSRWTITLITIESAVIVTVFLAVGLLALNRRWIIPGAIHARILQEMTQRLTDCERQLEDVRRDLQSWQDVSLRLLQVSEQVIGKNGVTTHSDEK